ncbi:DUF2442 domain-containing protein [Spirosoma aerolatum]|uniref:DUF2442 domain-containing protein n=1 Tax=Spirosoma aerolatum TaxID=1211326 RepID=UPI0009AE208D|nr:DUF2442 domain-containing protein [Spirosoma aerolatum]
MRTLAVTEAEYIDGYRLKVYFTDGTTQLVDVGPFLQNHSHPQHNDLLCNIVLPKI